MSGLNWYRSARRAQATAWLLFALGSVALTGCGLRVSDDPAPDMEMVKKLRAGGESQVSAVAKPTGTGWGALRGAIHYGAAAPGAAFLSTANKDSEVCGAQVPNETLIVDPASKGIANVLVFARKVSRVKPDAVSSTGATPEFDQKKCLFLQHLLVVQTKYPLLLRNSDPLSHNTNASPTGNPPFNVLLPGGQTSQYKFVRQMAAPSEATCSIHPWMKAYIMSRDDPYFAVTGKDGSFEIANLPAGEDIEFQVWHERAAAGLTAGVIKKGRFKLKVPADGVEDLKVIDVPAGEF